MHTDYRISLGQAPWKAGFWEQWNVMPSSALCRAFLAWRRGARHSPKLLVTARRDGALKMDWTKPPQDARCYGD
jgi:hypothetical protein